MSSFPADLVKGKIHEAGFYVDVDTSDRTIQKKVREAQMAQYNHILVVGEEEDKTGQVRDQKEVSVKVLEELLKSFEEEAFSLVEALCRSIYCIVAAADRSALKEKR